MGVSLKDVAARAGVSFKTVSNVVNGNAVVAPATKARVEAAIAELRYRPNMSARNLRGGRTGLVALAIPEIDAPYFAELARELIAAAQPKGWTILVEGTGGIREQEVAVLTGIRPQLVDGVILSPSSLNPEDLPGRRDDIPLVLLGERLSDGLADHVAIDNIAAARQATSHLLARGRRRVAFIGAQPGPTGASGVSRLRLEGFRAALSDASIEAHDEWIAPVEVYRRDDGARALRDLLRLDDRPDAVFCGNDLLALGALRVALEEGLGVPEDLAIIGIDDIEDGRWSTPTLSTVAPDKRQIATTAVELLAERMQPGADLAPRERTARFTLRARESTVGRSAGSVSATGGQGAPP